MRSDESEHHQQQQCGCGCLRFSWQGGRMQRLQVRSEAGRRWGSVDRCVAQLCGQVKLNTSRLGLVCGRRPITTRGEAVKDDPAPQSHGWRWMGLWRIWSTARAGGLVKERGGETLGPLYHAQRNHLGRSMRKLRAPSQHGEVPIGRGGGISWPQPSDGGHSVASIRLGWVGTLANVSNVYSRCPAQRGSRIPVRYW